MATILLTDCWTRKSLSAIRSLGIAGAEVHAVTHKRLSPAAYSRYAAQSFMLPDPASEPAFYLERVLCLLRSKRYDCVIPLEESSIAVFVNAREQIEHYTRLPIAQADSFHTANNKWQVLQIARQLAVPIPETFLPANEYDLRQAAATLGYPLIIKPVTSSGSRGLGKVHSEAALLEIYRSTLARYGPPLVQECIPQHGEGVGVAVLADHGKVLVDFSHRRLREFPVNGGPSTLRESTDDSEIKQYAAAIIGALGWSGVGMVEFKRDPRDGKAKLMEVNPRFWGSLHLCYVSGVNFPYLLYEWCMGREVKQPLYRTGVRCRWLLPGDVAHFLANPDRFHMNPSFFRLRGVYYDEFIKGDLSGNFASVWCALLSAFDPEAWARGVLRR
jgi:predicted ATP-grasp superfamily ATP-dependent carboligase